MKTRITSIALLAAMLTTAAACGETTPPDDSVDDTTSSQSVETTVPEITSDLPDKDWGGEEFMVLGQEDANYSQFQNFEIYAESENGEVVNDAIFRRNSTLEDKYNVKISQTLVTTPASELSKTITAGEDLYDLAFVKSIEITSPALQGYFYDLYNVEYIDFDKPWWNPDVNEAVELCGKLFFTTSDFSLRDKNRVYIMTHNRDMLVDYNLTPIVDLVREGTWTIDKMTEYSKAVAADLDGNGMLPVEDRWGLTMDSTNVFGLLLYSSGNRILSSNSNGELELVMNNERMISAIDKIISVVCDEDSAFYCERWNGKVDYDYWSASSKTFKAGNSLLNCAFPHSLKTYSADCTFDYGIIPPPKYDEEQEKYLSLADPHAMLFAIPSSSATPDFSGFMLEALSYASDDVLNAYYEITCKTKYTYDPDSAEMLDIIFDGIVFDIGYIMDIGGLKSISNDIANSGENTFASLYASKESSALKKLDEIAEKVAEIG